MEGAAERGCEGLIPPMAGTHHQHWWRPSIHPIPNPVKHDKLQPRDTGGWSGLEGFRLPSGAEDITQQSMGCRTRTAPGDSEEKGLHRVLPLNFLSPPHKTIQEAPYLFYLRSYGCSRARAGVAATGAQWMLFFSRGEMLLALGTVEKRSIKPLKTKLVETGSGCTQECREGGQK